MSLPPSLSAHDLATADAQALQLDNVMIDIETLGTKPGAAVLSIGAVVFGAAGLGAEFYSPVSLQSCTDVGLMIDPDTVAWWMKQSDAARAAAFAADAPPLPAVLLRFADWLLEQQARYPWCHGATFDVPILDAAYHACYLPTPWKFYDVRDTRTLYDLAGVKVDRSRGTHHNALDDARAQAEAAVKALNMLKPFYPGTLGTLADDSADDPRPDDSDATLGYGYRTMLKAHRNGLKVDFTTGMISLPDDRTAAMGAPSKVTKSTAEKP